MTNNIASPKGPKKIGNYIMDPLPFENGSFSKVFKAFNVVSNTNFVAKVYSLIPAAKFKILIYREIEYFEKNQMPNIIVRLKETQQSPNNLYMIYEYYEYNNLFKILSSKENPLDLNHKIIIANNIAKGINILHRNKFMHRTIQTRHILLNKKMDQMLFSGNKSIYYFKDNYPSENVGTTNYKAPEIESLVMVGKTYDEKVDIYSFGVVLYILFSGPPAFNNFNLSLFRNDPSIPECIKELIHGCTLKEPKERFNSEQILDPSFYKICENPQLEKAFPPNPLGNANIIEVNLNPEALNVKEKQDLNPYQLGNVLGQGAFGEVLELTNVENGQIFVLKRIKSDKLNNDKVKQLMYGEYKLLNELRDLSFVIKIFDYFHFQGELCMILEYCNGDTLEKYVGKKRKKKGQMDLNEIRLVAGNLAEGLNILHERNIIHRDLKPENIMLVKGINEEIIDCKICDLGLGKKLEENNPEFNTRVGTELYKAPELRDIPELQNAKLTNKVDVYSFGLILYFMVFSNHAYFKTADKAQFKAGNITFPESKPHFSKIIDLIKKCIKLDPEERISFKQIVNHEFFHCTYILKYPKEINLNNFVQIRKSQYSIGFKDIKEEEFLKIYDHSYVKTQNALKYLQREINFLLISKNTPHIVIIRNFGFFQKSVALTFDYCNGGNLEEFARSRGLDLKKQSNFTPCKYFSDEEIKLVAKSLIEFIDDMHGRNYLHRSINPKHILVIKKEIVDEQSKSKDKKFKIDQIKLCGFKNAKSEDNKLNSKIPEKETLMFTDPLSNDEGFFEESDLWSIGLVIFYMAFGIYSAKNVIELKNIRKLGKIIFPQFAIEENLKKFIEFCIRRRELGDLAQKVLKDELLKENILL